MTAPLLFFDFIKNKRRKMSSEVAAVASSSAAVVAPALVAAEEPIETLEEGVVRQGKILSRYPCLCLSLHRLCTLRTCPPVGGRQGGSPTETEARLSQRKKKKGAGQNSSEEGRH